MKHFTGWQYLLIDAANQIGHDKLTFEERIQWAEQNLHQLEQLAEGESWKERPLYIKAVQAIRKAQKGIPTGHRVGLDAVCSGMQIMSAITGCRSGSAATGLIDQDRRADAYTDCDDLMGEILGRKLASQRKKVKNAVMTSLYGSKKEPKNEFGHDTPELEAFYRAMYELAPGACELLEALLNSWEPYALVHQWVLPDCYHSYVKVTETVNSDIEIDELNHHTFTYIWEENVGKKKGVNNAANVIHSLDAYILRTLVRRCMYRPAQVRAFHREITTILVERSIIPKRPVPMLTGFTDKAAALVERYRACRVADISLLDHITPEQLSHLSSEHLRRLNRILATMLEHEPFQVLAVHDEFTCHANHMNHLRNHYRHILADLAEGDVLTDILSQLFGTQLTYPKLDTQLHNTIREANYALC